MSLPDPGPTPVQSSPRALRWAVILLVFGFQLAFFAWYPKLRSPNELTRVYLASALVEGHTVIIDGPIAEYGRIFDVSVREVDGQRHYYCDKAPGVSLLAVPALWAYRALSAAPSLAGKVRLVRLCAATLPTLLLLALLARFMARWLKDERLVALLALLYGLGSVAAPYGGLAFGHQLSALLLFGVFLLVAGLDVSTRARAFRGGAAVGAVAACAVVAEYQNTLLLLPFGVFFLVRVRRTPAALGGALLGALPVAAVLLGYHQAAFGSPFKTGYSFLESSFKEVHAQGMLGVAWPRAAHAYLSFLSPAKGLYFFAPWLALGVPGLWLAQRTGALTLRIGVVFVVLYALFVSALIYPVGGWTVSQRHLVPSVPFMLVPVGLCVQRLGRAGFPVLGGLGLPALLFCGLSACVFPHYQEHLQNPFWQLGWPLFRQGLVAPSPLNALGLSSAALAVGFFALAALLALALVWRSAARPRDGALAVAAALALCAATLGLSRLPGRAQDVRGDLGFAEDMIRSVRE